MLPGPKVGLVIGKGGETIKQLQEKSGKFLVIQLVFISFPRILISLFSFVRS